MVPGASAFAMMAGPSMDDEGQSDPRSNLMKALLLQHMSGDQQQDEGQGAGNETGGQVGTRKLDTNTTPPSAPSAGTEDLESHGMASRLAPHTAASSTPAPDPIADILQKPLPSSYPATQPKEEAAAMLKKAQESPDVNEGRGRRVLRALAPIIPFAGPPIAGELNREHHQGMEKVQLAREEYNTQAGLEQQQRDQALRERVAQANIESTRAMRSLMVSMQERGQDVRAQSSANRDVVSGAKAGYDVNQGSDGQTHVTPKSPMDMSELQRRSMEVQQATEQLKKAQAMAVPEMVDARKKALDIANERLSVYLQNTQFNQDKAREELDFRENGPTAATRGKAQQATVIGEAGQNLVTSIQSHKDVLGPVMGRYSSLADFVGDPPKGYAGLASELTTYIALQPAAHGFRGAAAVREFEKSIGTPIRTPEALIEAIGGNVRGLTPMMGAGNYQPPTRAIPGNPATILKRAPSAQPRNATPRSSPGTPGVRSVTRGADGKLTFAPASQ